MVFWQNLSLDGRVVSARGARSRATRGALTVFRGASCVTGMCTITIWIPLLLRLIQTIQEVARNTSAERRNCETIAFRNRRCNHLFRAQETVG